MKMSIAWHRERLRTHTEYLRREKADMANKRQLIDIAKRQLEFLSKQVSEAERRGLDGFDDEKFLKPKRIKQKP